MASKIVFISVCFAALAVIITSFFAFRINIPETSNIIERQINQVQVRGIHNPLFWEQYSFEDAILRQSKKQSSERAARGGIIPHHLLASDIIAEFFYRIREQPIKRAVIIGPNHRETGRENIITSYYGWLTPAGVVGADADFIEALLEKAPYAGVNEDVAEYEHSISGIMPFIAHYMPSAKVVPIIVSTETNIDELDDLAGILNSLSDDETLFIASVDFSHYLSSREAKIRDKTTLELLKDRNFDSFLALNNEYTDSPKSVFLMFKITNLTGLFDFSVLRHENSGEIMGNEFGEVTSYFSIVFEE